MKKLLIIRHSKTEDISEEKDDFDRELTEKGKINTFKISSYLKDKKLDLDYILTSPAARAISTAKIIAEELNFKKNLSPNQYVYEPFLEAIRETITYIHDSNNTVILVGHNPGLSTLAYTLCGSKENMKTSSIIEIDFNCSSWLDISKENSTFISYTKVEDL